MTDLVTEIWVVSCDRHTQLHRIVTRDALTATFQARIDAAAAQRRIDSQMSLTDKIALADVNLDNSTNITNLEAQIDRLF